MGFFSSFTTAFEAALIEYEGRAAPLRAAPPPHENARRMDTETAPAEPVLSASDPPPIKLGYYCDGGNVEPICYHGERHLVLFGLNGAGKSTRFLIELMMTMLLRSMFVFDIKGELTAQTSEERARYSDVRIINPYKLHGLRSDGHNPLARIDPSSPLLYDICAALADALIEIEAGSGQFWSESAQGLLTALIMFEVIVAAQEARTPSLFNVRMMLTEADEYEIIRGPRGKLTRGKLVKGLSITAARMVVSGNATMESLASRFVREHGQNELAGIQSTAATQTEWMLSEPMHADLEKDGVDFAQLRRTPTTVYVILPANQVRLKRRWTRLLLASALNAHLEPGPVNTLFVLDEFRASVGKLDIVKDMWSLVRGYGVQLMPILQSALQLQALFKEEWENYVSQAGLVATLGPPGDLFTAKWMSERCGVTTIMQASYNLGAGENSGSGVNTGNNVADRGMSTNQGQGFNYGNNMSGGMSFNQVERRAFLPQELMDMEAGAGRIWVPGLGSQSIPFFAPNYWKRRAPWVARVKPNPYRKG
jgi:type IV secretion system protein VirD4